MGIRLALAALATALTVALTGCAGSEGGSVPASASLAPADALAYVSLVTDAGSEQWQRGEQLLDAFTGARDSLVEEVGRELETEGLSWSEDVAPALGPEVVTVVTAGRRPVVLVQPSSPTALDRLLALADTPLVRGSVSGWTALAEQDADLVAYRAALARGTLDTTSAFVGAVSALPPDALARGWVDLAAATDELGDVLSRAGTDVDLGLESLAAAVTAREDGLLVAMGIRTPEDTGSTSYEPELFASVPADAVAALSFGGTQGTLDRVAGVADLDGISRQLEELTGVSLDGVLDALSGEGLLYVRPGASIPEVTVLLAPPDVDRAWRDVDTLVRRLAAEAGSAVTTGEVGDLDVFRVEVEGITVTYARLDDAVIVTTAPGGIEAFLGDGAKLVDSDAFARAADGVGLGDRTSGFVYLDVDGVLELAGETGGADAVPDEARDALDAVDAFILEADRDGDTTTLSGFVRVDAG